MITENNGVLLDIPELVRPLLSRRALETLASVRTFVETEIIPIEVEIQKSIDSASDKWATYPQIVETLKAKARSQGLWNLFLPSTYAEGAGFTNLEYALMAEQMGRVSHIGSEVFNCSAPDTGNMEVLARFGSEAQKAKWLQPLLEGRIRSAFCMTERGVASSDARNVGVSIIQDGSELVINGTKWWSSGAGDPRCTLLLVMGKTSPNSPDPYKQQSVVLVPKNIPGVKVVRPLTIFGYDDAPHGHMEVQFNNVRVPVNNMIAGEGRGFEIVQSRLGPGRIHHCMRALGAAAEALSLLVGRAKSRTTFGKQLVHHGAVAQWIVDSRIELAESRLLVLSAAYEIDVKGPKRALEAIAAAKIRVPSMALRIIDRAIQIYGAEGVSQDTPLAYLWASIRTLRIADGPDEVHAMQLARRTAHKL